MNLPANSENFIQKVWPMVEVFEDYDTALIGTDEDETNYPPASLDGIDVETLH